MLYGSGRTEDVMKQMDPNVCINMQEAVRYLGYGDNEPDENIKEELEVCKNAILKAMEPKYMYKVFKIQRDDDEWYVGDYQLALLGSSIKEHLAECEYVALGCATLSEGVDILIDETQKHDMLHSLLLDSLANAAIEEVRMDLEKSLAKDYLDYEINWQFGIGYGDLPLSLQKEFLALIQAKEEIGVRTNDASILIPLKSVSGFIGLKRKGTNWEQVKPEEIHKKTCGRNNCESCVMNDRCMFRKRL